MQDELLKLQEKDQRTIVFISHDLEEALRFGDRIAIMEGGRVVQIGSPEEILQNPAIKKFFEVFTLPLKDINAQNTRMDEGEKSQKDIERHVSEWIAKNKAKWDGWLQAARDAAQ